MTSLGAPLVAAHFFIFYFGVISSITPPVALAAYGASGISGANPMQTGFTACRLALSAFIVPLSVSSTTQNSSCSRGRSGRWPTASP